MTYRLIIALRQFYKRREHVTKNIHEAYWQRACQGNVSKQTKTRKKERKFQTIVNRRHLGVVGRRELVTKKAQAENDMTKTLVVVVLIFMLCQIMNPIRRFIAALTPPSGRGCGGCTCCRRMLKCIRTYPTERSWLRFVLLLLRLSDADSSGCRRFISLLHLQHLQQALRGETLAEVETPGVQIKSDTRHSGTTGAGSSDHTREAYTERRQYKANTGTQSR